MHNKKINNSKTKNFIQGLRPFSSSIPYGLKKILKKGGYNFSNIVENWTKMVGKEISDVCYPVNIKVGHKNLNNGTLILNVIHGKELEVEYNKKSIIDKINSFFGYNCISKIKLFIVRERQNTKKKLKMLNQVNKKFEDKLNKIRNNDLKNSLNRFIKAYNEKNN